MTTRPHLVYLAIGFPPAAKSSAYRMRETANCLAERGWDVTAVSIERSAWDLEYGVDLSLLDGLHPRVTTVEMPLRRTDLDPDIRTWSRLRARRPSLWRERQARRDEKVFPERVFGGWRPVIEQTVLEIHREHPVNLCLVTPAPYTSLAGGLRLAREGVPLAVDYRDGWSLDVLGGGEAFAPNSRAGRIEAEVIRLAQSVWVVNQPIADWYAKRYPDLGDRLSVVRNGFDPVAVPTTTRRPDPAAGLTFAYVGTVNFMPALTQALLEGWTLARASDEVMARSSLVFRGHMGAGHGRGANAHARMVDQTAGVTYGGPVRKADLAGIYSGVDALVLALAGGRYVTSGKVYEYGATGLPILSVHEAEHDAHAVLADYPLHAVAASLDAEGVRDGFLAARNLALQATDADRQQARAVGARFERRRQLEPAVAALAERFER